MDACYFIMFFSSAFLVRDHNKLSTGSNVLAFAPFSSHLMASFNVFQGLGLAICKLVLGLEHWSNIDRIPFLMLPLMLLFFFL